jgi:hypothetical protein
MYKKVWEQRSTLGKMAFMMNAYSPNCEDSNYTEPLTQNPSRHITLNKGQDATIANLN